MGGLNHPGDRFTQKIDPTLNQAAPQMRAQDGCRCPMCGEPGLIRVHRRPVDRLLSLFVGLQRFRCPQFECQWEGNLSKHRIDKGTLGRQAQSNN